MGLLTPKTQRSLKLKNHDQECLIERITAMNFELRQKIASYEHIENPAAEELLGSGLELEEIKFGSFVDEL